ncbi:hypothetical protein D3C80_1604870 [compost metagenome]
MKLKITLDVVSGRTAAATITAAGGRLIGSGKLCLDELWFFNFVDNGNREVFYRNIGRCVPLHQQLCRAQTELAGTLAGFQQRGRRKVGPIQLGFFFQRIT